MIQSLQLENWKTHSNISLNFKPGTNILIGPIGSGKSSILQAISFALFGTFAELKSRDVKLSDLIRRSSRANSTNVSLTLNNLTVVRKIDKNKGTEATVRNQDGVFIAGPNPTAVNEYISQILKIDEGIFLRNIYAMQNEIDLLLKLSPKERKKRTDELMGLDKFESARVSCITLKNKISNEAEILKKIKEEVNVQELNNQLKILIIQCDNLKAREQACFIKLEKISKDREQARIKLDKLRKQVQEVSKLEMRSSFLAKQIESATISLSGRELTLTKKEVESKLYIIKSQITKIQNHKTILALDIETSQKASLALEREIGVLEEKNRELQSRLAELHKIKEQLTEVKLIEVQKLEKVIQEKTENKQTLIAELKILKESLDRLNLAESTCPVCESRLTEKKKLELISKKKRAIAEKLLTQNETAEELNNLKKQFAELEKLSELQKRFSEKLAEEGKLIKEQRKTAEKLASSQKEKDNLKEMISTKSSELRQLEIKIENLGSKYTSLIDSKHLYELKEQRELYEGELAKLNLELADKKIEPKVLDEAELYFQNMLRQEQAIQFEIESNRHLLAEKKIRLEELKNRLEGLEEIEKKVNRAEKNIEFLNRFAAALQATQIALRDELILAVNEVMTSLWLDLYPYDNWVGLRLFTDEDDYVLQLKEADGDWISVIGFASGGERMIASLAVRIAFARILSPSFSLLILDEPTHNLDERAIDSLIELIQSKLSEHIEQILIVTHNEKLAEVGDNVVRL